MLSRSPWSPFLNPARFAIAGLAGCAIAPERWVRSPVRERPVGVLLVARPLDLGVVDLRDSASDFAGHLAGRRLEKRREMMRAAAGEPEFGRDLDQIVMAGEALECQVIAERRVQVFAEQGVETREPPILAHATIGGVHRAPEGRECSALVLDRGLAQIANDERGSRRRRSRFGREFLRAFLRARVMSARDVDRLLPLGERERHLNQFGVVLHWDLPGRRRRGSTVALRPDGYGPRSNSRRTRKPREYNRRARVRASSAITPSREDSTLLLVDLGRGLEDAHERERGLDLRDLFRPRLGGALPPASARRATATAAAPGGRLASAATLGAIVPVAGLDVNARRAGRDREGDEKQGKSDEPLHFRILSIG